MLAKQILGCHKLLEGFAGPAAAIDVEQAEQLARSIDSFCREYGFAITGKAAATLGLIFTLIAVEGPVLLAIIGRLRGGKRSGSGKGLVLRFPSEAARADTAEQASPDGEPIQ
ncbi:MAG TPA: hypothetical protein EYP19_00055 [Desulfobacterales bacterium]|nr:hypothetical protein [Desulfobacterales bacterium]